MRKTAFGAAGSSILEYRGENVAVEIRRDLLGHYVSEDLAEALDNHYQLEAAGDHSGALRAETRSRLFERAMRRHSARDNLRPSSGAPPGCRQHAAGWC